MTFLCQVSSRKHTAAVERKCMPCQSMPVKTLYQTQAQILGQCSSAYLQVGSTILAQAAGVPTLPWSGSDVSVSYKNCGGTIPADVYDRACIHNVEEALSCCQHIEYPCMLKASWGGGGKGIRKVLLLHKAWQFL